MNMSFTRLKGFVLINTLILTLIALIMLLGLTMVMYYGHRLSGLSKRYTSALEAAKGGTLECIGALDNCSIFSNPFKCECCTDKWANYSNDTQDLISHKTPQDIVNYADWHKSYGNYDVYCKIVETNCPCDSDGMCSGDHIFYALEIVGRRKGKKESAWLTVGVVKSKNEQIPHQNQ